MPSSYSVSLRFELQFTGENINLWGDKLNVVLQHADFAIAGIVTQALTGDYALTTANLGDDQARAAILKFTGSVTSTVTIPSVSKTYDVWNGCTVPITLTTGAGAAAQILAGEVCRVICDGSNVQRVVPTTFGGVRLQNVADPTSPQDVATKAYVDNTAWTYNAGNLPGQSPAVAGYALLSSGSVAGWTQLTSANLSDTAARDAAALGRAIAFAVAF